MVTFKEFLASAVGRFAGNVVNSYQQARSNQQQNQQNAPTQGGPVYVGNKGQPMPQDIIQAFDGIGKSNQWMVYAISKVKDQQLKNQILKSHENKVKEIQNIMKNAGWFGKPTETPKNTQSNNNSK